MTTNNNNCAGCGCNDTIPQPCAPAPPVCATPQPCTEILDAQCVKYTGPAITCNDVNIIPQNTSVADALNALVDLVCDGNCCAIPAVTNIEDPNFIMLCRDQILSCVYNGLLYNWLALNTGITGDGRLSGGIVNVNPLDNIINTWRVPNDADWYALALALDPTATNVPWNNAAGGKVKSTTCWSLPNSGATNESSLSVVPSVYRNPSGSFSNNNGQIGVYWSASQVLSTTANGYSLVHIDDSIFKSSYLKGHGFRVRLVRPIDCTELNGDFIPNAYKDNSGNLYNAKVIGTLVWITEDLRDIKFNNNTNIPVATLDSAWSATTVGAYCLPDNRSNYESNYTVGCEQVKISFQNFLDAIPTGSAKAVDVVRNWGTCVTTQEVTTPEEKTIYSVAIEDSGWQDLQGFDFYEDDMALRKPQVRRVGTVLHFRGDIIIPLGVSENLIPITDSSLYSKVYRKTPYQTVDAVTLGKGVFVDQFNRIFFNCTSALDGTTESVIPANVLPANINLDNTYRSSNVIGLRTIKYTADQLTSGYADVPEAPASEKSGEPSVFIIEPTDQFSSVTLSTYAHVEITQDKKLRITPLETIEVDKLSINPSVPSIQLEGNSILRNIVTNFNQTDLMLSMLKFDVNPTGSGQRYTEQSATQEGVYIDSSSGYVFSPGSLYVVARGDDFTGVDFSNISDVPANTQFSTIYINGSGAPNSFGGITLVDIRAYQTRPIQYTTGLGQNYKWPQFLDSSGEEFRYDASRAQDMGGFVFNLDNLQAFTDVDNCYSTCENTPLPAEEGCCKSPLVYLVETALAQIQSEGGDIYDIETVNEKMNDLVFNTVTTLDKATSTLCCQTCGFTNDDAITIKNPYLLCNPRAFIGYAGGSIISQEDLSCCFNVYGSSTVSETLETSIGSTTYNEHLCTGTDATYFQTCSTAITSILSSSYQPDILDNGFVEYNQLSVQSQLCELTSYLFSIYGAFPPIDIDGYNMYDYIFAALVKDGLAIYCTNDEIIICSLKEYLDRLQQSLPA